MKKIALTIFLILAAIASQGQMQRIAVRPVNANRITADTTYQMFYADYHYGWHIEVTWTANDGTTSTVQPMTRTGSTDTWTAYANISAQTVTGSTGRIKFEDADLWDLYLGLYVHVQSGKTVTVTIKYIPTIKK